MNEHVAGPIRNGGYFLVVGKTGWGPWSTDRGTSDTQIMWNWVGEMAAREGDRRIIMWVPEELHMRQFLDLMPLCWDLDEVQYSSLEGILMTDEETEVECGACRKIIGD